MLIVCIDMVIKRDTQQPLYNMIHYSMVLDIRRFKDGPQKCCIQTKINRLYKKLPLWSFFI